LTVWHEVYPEHCPLFRVINWQDNCNGVLSYCDNITLFNFTSEQITQWHVEELAVDMVVQEPAPPVHDVAVISVTPLFGSVFQGWPDPITVDVQNQGDFSETFTVSVYYGTNPVTTSPKTVTDLAPVATQTLMFCWVTTSVPPNTYTITANASIVPGETDTADNTLSDGSVTILPPRHSIGRPDSATMHRVACQTSTRNNGAPTTGLTRGARGATAVQLLQQTRYGGWTLNSNQHNHQYLHQHPATGSHSYQATYRA